MSKSILHRVEPSLRSFYIFRLTNTADKANEENEKILYYHPKDIENDTKIKDVGLSEGIIAFTDTFKTLNGGIECETVNTLKTLQIYYQPERAICMVMVINNPKEIHTKDDGVEFEEYCNGELHEVIYQHYLQHLYARFCLENGTFEMDERRKTGDRNSDLKLRLEEYFDSILCNLKLPLCDIIPFIRTVQYLPLSKSLFLRMHNFINMLKATFSKITDAMLLFNEQILNGGKFDPITLYTIYDYIQDLCLTTITSTLKSNTTKLVSLENTYINANRYSIFLPFDDYKATHAECNSENCGKQWIPHYLYIYCCNSSCLLLFVKINDAFTEDGLKDLQIYIDVQLPLISNDIHDYLITNHKHNGNNYSGGSSGSGNLLMTHHHHYHHFGTTNNNSIENAAVATSTATAAISLLTNSNSANTNPKYLFINEQTLKHLGNLTESLHRTSTTPLKVGAGTSGNNCHLKHRQYASFPNNILNLLVDLMHYDKTRNDDEIHFTKENLSSNKPKLPSQLDTQNSVRKISNRLKTTNSCTLMAPPEYEETLLKSTEDFWIVKRQCNWRQFYVIIFSKKSTLLNVMEEVERIFENEIIDDVFFDK